MNTGGDDFPVAYTNGSNVYLTNRANNGDDQDILTLSYNPGASTLTAIGDVVILTDFRKTTNAIIHQNGNLYTFINGVLEQYSLTDGSHTVGTQFKGYTGNLFSFNGDFYYTSGEVAKKMADKRFLKGIKKILCFSI